MFANRLRCLDRFLDVFFAMGNVNKAFLGRSIVHNRIHPLAIDLATVRNALVRGQSFSTRPPSFRSTLEPRIHVCVLSLRWKASLERSTATWGDRSRATYSSVRAFP